jgi:hypothetical protein
MAVVAQWLRHRLSIEKGGAKAMTVQNSFRGRVTNVETVGNIANSGEVPVGANVSGSYTMDEQDPDHGVVTIDLSLHGTSNAYDCTLSTDDDWGTYTPGNFTWNNTVGNGLETVYFGGEGADAGGYVSFDIPATGSVTTTSYMRFFIGAGAEKREVRLTFEICSIPSAPQNLHVR